MAWRDTYRYDPYLFLLPKSTVFAAQVNQATISYPLAQVTFDNVTTGAYTDIVPGMTVLFGSSAGDDDLGRGRVRKAATSTILYIGWSSQGTHDGECNLANDAYITVINDYRAWAKIPRLVNLQDQYKDYDLAYTEGVDIPPLANGGADVLKMVDGSGEISVDFAGVATVLDPGAAITTHAWDFVDGTPASAATASVSGVTFPYGWRYVSYTVTDDNGNTHTHRILVVAGGKDYPQEISYSGATITSSSELSASYLDDYAFDNDGGTQWLADGNDHWIKIQLASAQTITHYGKDQTAFGTAAADTAILYGSNNDVDYTAIDTRTGLAGAEVAYNWTIQNPGSYSYYRLNLTSSGIYVGTWELDLKIAVSNVITNFEVVEQTLTREGQTFRVIIHDDIDADTYLDGTKCLYMEREYYAGVEGSLAGPADREHMKFIGWHVTDRAAIETTDKGPVSNVELEFQDIAGRMRNLPAFSAMVGRIGTSTAWYLVPSATTDRFIHYLLHWHSTVLEVAPFTLSGTSGTYALPFYAATATNLWEQVVWRTRSIGYELTCSMQGELKMIVDPMLQDSGDRTSTIITDIDPQDWGEYGALDQPHQYYPRIHWVWSNAVVASTSYVSQTGLNINAVFAVAPGEAPGQGGIDQTQGEWLVVDQTELNARTGHLYARLNAEDSMWTIPLVHGGDVGIDPAKMEWIRLTIASAQAAPRGLTLTDERFLPFQVTISHNKVSIGNGVEVLVKSQVVTAERETVGTPAATYIPETGSVVPPSPSPDEWPIIFDDNPVYDLSRGAATIALIDTGGNLHTTNDYYTPAASNGPTWTTTDLTGLSPALSGTLLAAVMDPFSPAYLGSGTTVNGWILTTTGIYSVTDLFGVSTGPTLALQHTLANTAEYGFIATGIGVQNWIVAGYHNGTAAIGTKCVRTTNGGTTWTESTVTAHYDSASPTDLDYQPPIFVSSAQAGLVYMGAFSATQDTPPGALYRSTDYGATWAAATDITVSFGELNGGSFVIPWHDNAGQKIAYWTKDFSGTPGDTAIGLGRTESDGTTTTDISPLDGSVQFGARRWWGIGICPTNRQRIALAGFSKESTPRGAIFVSLDGGDSWVRTTDLVSSGIYHGVAIAGNDPDVMYAFGADLTVAYSQDYGANWDDRSGNLSGSDDIVLMVGG